MDREKSWFSKKTKVKLEVPSDEDSSSESFVVEKPIQESKNDELVEKLVERVSSLENLFKTQERALEMWFLQYDVKNVEPGGVISILER